MKIFKVKNLNRKKIITAFLVGLFILSALTVIDSSFASSNGGSHALASTSTDSFTFPYQYGTPTIPSDVGAQGIQGPNVPMSNIGPTIATGVKENYGIHGNDNYNISTVPYKVTLQVLNGTISTSSIAKNQKVTWTNMTSGNQITLLTNTNGYANETLISGWWILDISPTSTSYLPFQQTIRITSNVNLVRYLIPSSYSTISISNGVSTTKTTVYAYPTGTYSASNGGAYGGSPLSVISQLPVDVFNVSGGNVLMGTVYTGENGSATITNISTTYQYSFYLYGLKDNLTGVTYSLSNYSTGTISLTSHKTYELGYYGMTTFTGKVVSGSLSFTTNTILQNGTLIMSNRVGSNNIHITVNNSIIFINTTYAGYNGIVFSFNNDTIEFLTQSELFYGTNHVYMNYSVMIGTNLSKLPNDGLGMSFSTGNCSVYDLTAKNSIMEGVNTEPTGGADTMNAIFNNSLLINNPVIGLESGVFSMYNTTVINTTFIDTTTGNTIGTDTIYGVQFTNSIYSVQGTKIKVNVEQTNLTETFTKYSLYNEGNNFDLVGDYENISHDYFTVKKGNNLNFTKFYDDYSSSSTHPSISFGSQVNISYSYFNLNLVRLPLTSLIFPEGNNKYTHVYDSVWNNNYTIPELLTWVNYSDSNPPVAPEVYIQGYNFTMNYSVVNIATFVQYWIINLSFNHDVFPYWLAVNQFDPIQVFWYPSTSFPGQHGQITNSTFKYTYFNYTLWYAFHNETSGGAFYIYGGVEWFEDNNYAGGSLSNYHQGTFNVMYNTFYAIPVGYGGNSGAPPTDVIANMVHVNTTLEYNLFLNDWKYNLGPSNSKYWAVPYATDVLSGQGNNTISNNWFLNLSNETVPIMQIGGLCTHFKESDNHFYYNPNPLQSNVQVYTTPKSDIMNLQGPNNTHLLPSIVYTQSYATYEIPMQNLPVNNISINNPQYIFNSTIYQADYPSSYDTWAYVIAPDVNVASGNPVISFDNGLVGGPQPNFIWKGYNYTESVEPTYIQVGVNSSKAPSIGIAFNGVAGELYHVQVINGNDVIQNISVVANSNGVVQVTYNPSTMPLDPIFNLIPPPSPSSPIHVILKKALSYTKLIAISASLLVIVAVAYFYTKSSGGKSGSGGGERRI